MVFVVLQVHVIVNGIADGPDAEDESNQRLSGRIGARKITTLYSTDAGD